MLWACEEKNVRSRDVQVAVISAGAADKPQIGQVG